MCVGKGVASDTEGASIPHFIIIIVVVIIVVVIVVVVVVSPLSLSLCSLVVQSSAISIHNIPAGLTVQVNMNSSAHISLG